VHGCLASAAARERVFRQRFFCWKEIKNLLKKSKNMLDLVASSLLQQREKEFLESSIFPQARPLQPGAETLNPKPETRNLKLSTLNPKPETRNPKP